MRRKIPIVIVIVTALALLLWWKYWPRNINPRNEIVWSVAVVRSLGSFTRNASTEFYVATTGAVYVPAALGSSWTKKTLSHADTRLTTLAVDHNGTIAGGTPQGEVYVSTDFGDSWSSYQVSRFPVSSIVILDDRTYLAATFGDGIYEFHREYSSWTRFDGEQINPNVWSLAMDEKNRDLIAITPKGAYSTQGYGYSWKRISGRTTTTTCAFSGSRFLAQKGNSLLVSDDRGKTATQVVFGNDRALGVWTLAGNAEGDAVVGTSSGIYWSNDSAKTWRKLEYSHVPAATASIFLLEETAFAQGTTVPRIEIPRSGPVGPPALPPIETRIPSVPNLKPPLNPTVQPQAPVTSRPLGSGTSSGSNFESSSQGSTEPVPPVNPPPETSSGNADGGSPPPPPPPKLTPMQPLPGLHCGVTEGEMVECNSDNLIKYLNSVLTAKDIAELVAKMVGESIAGDKDLYVVATETAVDATKLMIQLKKDEIVEDLVKKVIKTMMDAAVQQVAAFAQATSLPPRMAEVRAHEAYVQAIQSEAISESIKYVDTSVDSQNYSHSNLSINTSGPAFHQLSYSAIHGAGWW